jgi:hypothetical protein
MRSRNGKGAKVLQGITATGKIPQPAKFFNEQNLVAGGAKAEPPNFANRHKNWAGRKIKERRQGAGATICHPQNLPPRQKNYKSVKMIINYGG